MKKNISKEQLLDSFKTGSQITVQLLRKRVHHSSIKNHAEDDTWKIIIKNTSKHLLK